MTRTLFAPSRALVGIALLFAGGATAQTSGYRTPPAPIPQILGTPPAPLVSLSPDRSTMAFLAREGMPSIAQLAEPELRLAGVRINPQTNGPSRSSFLNGIAFAPVTGGAQRPVQLPQAAQISFTQWSPSGSHLAFVNTTTKGLELWVVDARTTQARRLVGPELNGTLGSPFDWMPDGASLLVRRIVPGRAAAPATPRVPSGPVIQESTGRGAPVRTFQDLLTNPHDEQLFDYYFTAQLARVPLTGGTPTPIGEPGIFTNVSAAPNGQYIRVDRIKRPYSYLAPLTSFASEINILDLRGRRVHQVANRPDVVMFPIGRDMTNPGPRGISWRADAPATLVWVEAQDSGNAQRQTTQRDRVLMLDAPFTGRPRTLIDLDQRFGGVTWGRNDVALVNSQWSTTSRTRTYVVNPSQPAAQPRVLWDRSSEDRYGNPGFPITTSNAAGFRVLQFTPDGQGIFLSGEGASPRGNYPFLDRMNLGTGKTERLWRNEDPHYEALVALVDANGQRILTRRESLTEAPNYYLRDLNRGTAAALTNFPDPAPQLAGIQRQIIT